MSGLIRALVGDIVGFDIIVDATAECCVALKKTGALKRSGCGHTQASNLRITYM